MYNSLLIFCIILIFYSCSDDASYRAKIIWEKYDSGNSKVEYVFFNDSASFNEDYYYQEYHQNGNIKIKGIENQRIKKGEWRFYTVSGELKAKVNFDNDTLHGPISIYGLNNKLLVQDTFIDGRLENNIGENLRLIKQQLIHLNHRPIWLDSLKITVDSASKNLKKK